MSIQAEEAQIIEIIQVILPKLDETAKGERTRKEGDYDLRMLIHQSQGGAVIGKSGSRIKEIREVSQYLQIQRNMV